MNIGYHPISLSLIAAVGALSTLSLLCYFINAYWTSRNLGRVIGWSQACLSVGLIHWGWSDEPAGIRMLALCWVLLLAMKSVVIAEVKKPIAGSQIKRLGAFFFLWPGMDPVPFLSESDSKQSLDGSNLSAQIKVYLNGAMWMSLGGLLLGCAHLIQSSQGSLILMSVCLLVGLSLVVHFGIFQMLTAFWRDQGVAVDLLFKGPLYSTSLNEFWSRRWNLAYVSMVRQTVYRPLLPHLGQRNAMLLAFIFSGILHELAISVPVHTGYGLPLLYFALHGLLMSIERRLIKKGVCWKPWIGRCWTLVWVVAPVPLLFHQSFIEGVVWPILG